MTRNERTRRLVVWADFSPESASAARWAAQHAEARALPVHLLHPVETSALAGTTRGGAGGFPGGDDRTVDAVRLSRDAHRLRIEHDVPVTVQVVEDEHGRPAPEHLEFGDILVTGPFGYRELTAGPSAAVTARAPLRVPVVVVPGDAQRSAARPRMLLLTGLHLARTVAAFAFSAAADLGAGLDVVRIVPQSAAFGDDYWVDPTRSPYLAESRLKQDLDVVHHQYPQVVWNSVTLRVRPWRTLRTMAGSAQLAVLPVDHRASVSALRILLDSGSCPVALVAPDRGPGEERTNGSSMAAAAAAV